MATQVSDAALQAQALSHYHLVAPLLEEQFAGVPIVYANYPSGLDAQPRFHVSDVALTAGKLLWCVHRFYALEFFTWAPLPQDDARLRFARILLEQPTTQTVWHDVVAAALAVRAVLRDAHVDAIPLADGKGGIALWVPLADAPPAATVRAWLHHLTATAIAGNPQLLSAEPNTRDSKRIHIHVSSNARNRYSAVPYSVRVAPMPTVCTPLTWDELAAEVTATSLADFSARLDSVGDLFAKQYEALRSQSLETPSISSPQPGHAELVEASGTHTGHTPEPRGHIINAAITILEDGKARSADDLCTEAIKRNLVPATTTRKYVYSALIEYIARSNGRGRKPPIVQDAQRNFRINEPPDDWPDLVPGAQPTVDAKTQSLCDRLDATGTGDDPTAFELAVCDAFAHLGFLTQHIGGRGNPDGVADAILGPLGYRVAIECKTAKSIVNEPDCAEVAKEMESLKAQFGVLVGPAFSDETELLSELQTHKVTAITISDLQTLLQSGANAFELQQLLQPGYLADVISDFLWNRQHGEAKRVATIAELLKQEGWAAQLTAAQQGGADNAPLLTIDAAMLLIDQALRRAGSTRACSRAEVESAIGFLTSPNVGNAIVSANGGLIIVAPEVSE